MTTKTDSIKMQTKYHTNLEFWESIHLWKEARWRNLMYNINKQVKTLFWAEC